MPNNCPIDLVPYDESKAINLPQISNTNYTNQDFWSLKSRLVDFINERFGSNGTVLPNTFNDLVESSVAIMLMEIYAFIGDTISFKQDQQFGENFIDSVTELENAFRLCKNIGMQPLPPVPARTLWTASINSTNSQDVILTTPVKIGANSNGVPVNIELFPCDSNYNPIFNQPIIIPAGATSISSIVGLEGKTTSDTIDGTGEIGQTFRLQSGPVAYNSIEVTVNGSIWNKVDYFTDSQPRQEYRVEFDSDYNAYIIFGNNRAGLIPSVGSVIVANYRVGGGAKGNIVSNFITTQYQAFVDNLGFSVTVSLNNYTKGSYGYDGDGIDEIKRKYPTYLRTQNRAVTGLDYKTLTDQFATAYHGQIGKSNAVLRNHGCAGNIVDLYILAKDGQNGLEKASNELKVDLLEEINNKKMLTDYVCIKDGVVVYVDVQIDVTCDKFFKKFEAEIRENIVRRTNAFFSLSNWEYEQTLTSSDLIKQLSDLKQIKSLDLSFLTDNSDSIETSVVTTKFYEIIRSDVIEINFNYE